LSQVHNSLGFKYLLFLLIFQVYIIGGDGTQRGAAVIFEVIKVSKLEAVRDLG